MEKFQNKYRIQSHRMPKWDYSGNGIYFITLVTRYRICNLGQIKFVHDWNVYSKQHPAYIELSDFGKIIKTEWLKSFKIRKELLLDEYIIMPNHLHAIVVINKPENRKIIDSQKLHETNETNRTNESPEAGEYYGSNEQEKSCQSNESRKSRQSNESPVETHGRASLRADFGIGQDFWIGPDFRNNEIPINQSKSYRKPKSVSSFIAGFKSVINTKIDNYIDEFCLNVPKYNRKNHFFQPNYYDHIIRDEAEYLKIKTYIINNPLKWINDRFNPLNNPTKL